MKHYLVSVQKADGEFFDILVGVENDESEVAAVVKDNFPEAISFKVVAGELSDEDAEDIGLDEF